MGHHEKKPLTVDEAKAELRAAAGRVGPSAWLQRHPATVLGIAAAAGFLAAHMSRRDLQDLSTKVLSLAVLGCARRLLL